MERSCSAQSDNKASGERGDAARTIEIMIDLVGEPLRWRGPMGGPMGWRDALGGSGGPLGPTNGMDNERELIDREGDDARAAESHLVPKADSSVTAASVASALAGGNRCGRPQRLSSDMSVPRSPSAPHLSGGFRDFSHMPRLGVRGTLGLPMVNARSMERSSALRRSGGWAWSKQSLEELGMQQKTSSASRIKTPWSPLAPSGGMYFQPPPVVSSGPSPPQRKLFPASPFGNHQPSSLPDLHRERGTPSNWSPPATAASSTMAALELGSDSPISMSPSVGRVPAFFSPSSLPQGSPPPSGSRRSQRR
eukprot:TRINITY_DN25274_c0_g1_i1.p1 TRINITY_DN25274_c0_g1~~TRINITY_DN25274_c0_g1_i1.p1  ORF type:complete len:354 (-),score=60.47 TRINITY_DN25274_c0_g1_i1:87-1010(-)